MHPVEEAFRANERLLWGLGYRMTGLAADADELVQETFLRAMEHPVPDDGRPLRPWLVRVCANLARDRLRARRRRSGPQVWLPAPVPDDRLVDGLPATAPDDTPDARVSRAESASLAFLLALESLTPTQRAVLLLRDVFEHDAEEVADMLGSTPGAVRVAHHKARRALATQPTRRAPDPTAHIAALSTFLGAIAAGDAPTALAALAPDVVLRSDGGGVYHAAKVPVRGADKVVRFLASVTANAVAARWAVQSLNGLPMAVIEIPSPARGLAPRSAIGVTLADDGRIAAIHWVLDPTKLTAVPPL